MNGIFERGDLSEKLVNGIFERGERERNALNPEIVHKSRNE